eukprot:331668-Prymnesium_polylepis.1
MSNRVYHIYVTGAAVATARRAKNAAARKRAAGEVQRAGRTGLESPRVRTTVDTEVPGGDHRARLCSRTCFLPFLFRQAKRNGELPLLPRPASFLVRQDHRTASLGKTKSGFEGRAQG